MTARRAGFGGVFIGVLLAALYTGDRIFFLLLSFMALLLLFGLAHIGATIATFRFSQTLSSDHAVKGESLRLDVALFNETFIPYARLRATYWLPDNLVGKPLHSFEGDIPAYGRLQFTEQFQCTYRGEYNPGLASVRVTDLFGIIAITVPLRMFTFYKPLTLIVRPRILSLRDEAQVAQIQLGRMDSADVTAQEVSSVRDIRAFRPGDALKWVHFKLSARRRTMLVREFEGSARPRTLLVLDMHEHGREGVARLEIEDAMLEAATALTNSLLEERIPMRLVAFGAQRFEAGGSEPRDFGPMYAYYTLAKFDGQYPLTDILTLETQDKGMHLLVVTSQLDAKLSGLLLAIREAGNDVAAVVVATAQERVYSVNRAAEELSRRGVRCLVFSPNETIGSAGLEGRPA